MPTSEWLHDETQVTMEVSMLVFWLVTSFGVVFRTLGAGNFLTIWTNFSFTVKIVFHGISFVSNVSRLALYKVEWVVETLCRPLKEQLQGLISDPDPENVPDTFFVTGTRVVVACDHWIAWGKTENNYLIVWLIHDVLNRVRNWLTRLSTCKNLNSCSFRNSTSEASCYNKRRLSTDINQ